MKTAMQELKDWANQYEGQMISADQVVLKAHNLLKKEKEQIINAYTNGYGASFIDGDNRNFSRPQEYYNQNYNK